MNKVIIMGRVCNDPELRQTQSGVSSCKFTVAVDLKVADKNTGERQADFITCVAWRQTAEFVSRYFNKGKMILVEGSLRTGKYQDKNHKDVTHYTTDILVDNVEFCGDKGMATQTAAQQVVKQAQAAGVPTEYETILDDESAPF